MADENLFKELESRELESLDIFLAAKAGKMAITLDEYLQTRLLNGASREALLNDLLDDLENGGRIFGEFRRSIRATANGTIHRFRDIGQFSEEGVDQKYRWAAVLVNTCPDCIDRHGTLKSWEEWEADGLPRTGMTVCKENCRCVLIPEDSIDLQPVLRKGRP